MARLIFLMLMCSWFHVAQAKDCPNIGENGDERLVAVISDLHFGLGLERGNTWNVRDDFRWHGALAGFLERVSACAKDKADLVIAGDALELWQPPADIKCAGRNADTGCTAGEAIALARRVADAHRLDLKLIGKFADRGSNRVYFVPGNHDAALLLDPVWQVVNDAIDSKPGRVTRCAKNSAMPCTKNGWLSQPDGAVYIEHGHQIGSDVNRFSLWPDIVRMIDGTAYLERPWGQRFVQQIFNEQEDQYSIIDNLMPESAGVRYRMADRGLWGSVADVAKFLRFNILQTSWSQKAAELAPTDRRHLWNVKRARKLGAALYLDTLPPDDPLRIQATEKNTEGVALREELNTYAQNASPDEIQFLCDKLAVRMNGHRTCDGSDLGALGQKLLSKTTLMREHLLGRIKDEAPTMQVFVYAHTHQYEPGWDVNLKQLRRKVKIHNTGAFQRLISDDAFQVLVRQHSLPSQEALRRFRNEDLTPCYGAVFAVVSQGKANSTTLRWYEAEQGPGEFLETHEPACN